HLLTAVLMRCFIGTNAVLYRYIFKNVPLLYRFRSRNLLKKNFDIHLLTAVLMRCFIGTNAVLYGYIFKNVPLLYRYRRKNLLKKKFQHSSFDSGTNVKSSRLSNMYYIRMEKNVFCF
ncbi:MAG: hypothetical protein FD143_3758, partial [Ignavibacteria bacterium]